MEEENNEDRGENLCPERRLAAVERLLPILLATIAAIRVFIGRWQIIRARLEHLKSCISDVAESPHWTENELLPDLLRGVHLTLREARLLARRCVEGSFGGKLLMQSDLDVVAAKLGLHVHDLDLLIKSGVLTQSSAIVLSWPGPEASRDDVALFVRDIFARLQIGHVELKRKAMESLVQLITEDPKNAVLVSSEGHVGCLVQLIESPPVRDVAVAAVTALAAAAEGCRHSLVAEGAFGPLVRMMDCGGAVQTAASVAVAALTEGGDSETTWALAAYGGVGALVRACTAGTASSTAAAALRNISSEDEIRKTMAEEGAIPVLLNLAVSGSITARENSIECLYILASKDEQIRQTIAKDGGIQSLLHLLSESPTPRSQELVIRALNSLSASVGAARALISSAGFLSQLTGILKTGHATLQQLAAAAVCNLSFCRETKKVLGQAGCIPPLVKMLESKPSTSQEMAAQALSSLLVVETNRREFVKDDKSVARLVQLLDPRNQTVEKKFPLSALLALSSSKSCRKKIAMAGACQHLQKLSEMEVAGAKKILQRLAGSRLRDIFSRRWRS